MKKIEENFCESLFKWQSEHFKGTQAELGKIFNVSQGQIAKIFSKQRCGDETWRRMVAKKIGADYDSMIGVKKTDSKKIINFDNTYDEKHFKVTKKFKNKPMAIEINQGLVEIESYDPEELEEFNAMVQARLKRLRKKIKKQEDRDPPGEKLSPNGTDK